MKITGLVLVIAAMAVAGCARQPMFKDTRDTRPKPPEPVVAPAPKPDTVEKYGAPAETQAPAPKIEIAPAAKRSPQLLAGIEAYDNGKHREAAKILRSAFPKLNRVEQVEAHKYLAFIECSSGRKSQCREEFKKALSLDASFDLSPAEAGHPLWGPIFRSVKGSPRR